MRYLRRIRNQRKGVTKYHLGRLRCLSGVSTVRMVGCREAAKRHFLGVFPVRVVLVLTISVDLISSDWVKSNVGCTMTLIYSSETSCINYSSRMWPASSGMMAKNVGKFPGNLTYSELPSLPPELAADMTSLAWSSGNLGIAAGPSVSHSRF